MTAGQRGNVRDFAAGELIEPQAPQGDAGQNPRSGFRLERLERWL
jgi:hypothetical protein